VGIAPHDLHFPLLCWSDFQGLWEGRKTASSFSGLSIDRHFLSPFRWPSILRGQPQPLKEFGFCLLHPPRRIGIADGRGDPFQRVHT
jgi:hypothetical protein